jgi:hypothetical protein
MFQVVFILFLELIIWLLYLELFVLILYLILSLLQIDFETLNYV